MQNKVSRCRIALPTLEPVVGVACPEGIGPTFPKGNRPAAYCLVSGVLVGYLPIRASYWSMPMDLPQQVQGIPLAVRFFEGVFD
ncbi:MAG: hypothetical protein F6J93_27925 [Oscillatoria sp. SIO1A7]|nr:hypothetical protein [Oscillatoria sp. SIO1A7]